MDMTITIPESVAMKLREFAAASGEPVQAYTARLVAESVARPTLNELLGKSQANFANNGMSRDQVMDLGRSIVDRVRGGAT